MNNDQLVTTAQGSTVLELLDTAGTDAITSALDKQTLETWGVRECDYSRIREVAKTLDPKNQTSAHVFGRDLGTGSQQVSDDLLGAVTASELEGAGKKLTQVVSIAQKINLNSAHVARSNWPVIGPVIDRIKLASMKVRGQFESASEQIGTLLSEIAYVQENLEKDNVSLEAQKAVVIEEFHNYGVHIAAANLRIAELKVELVERKASAHSPLQLHELSELDSYITSLDKRAADLMISQQHAFQELPAISIMQSNNSALVDKYHTISTVTIPVWRRIFRTGLSLKQQDAAVTLADEIDEATNAMIRASAKLLKDNAIGVAKSNQRPVIDFSTLEFAQKTLIETVIGIQEAHQEGIAIRKREIPKIQQMRQQNHGLLNLDAPSVVH
ncbi:toxic anion resistance protein [Pseudomonas syringae]|uniref:toxic anion resistance protein n=1 Tax=Pseudomonas syringae TaxID=317 RepID=UPI000361CE91|nr:toxic anion resistance protein [Pseudomonas syringae]